MLKFFGKRLRNKKGFTLVELLVVIAVLGIIAGIAIPKMTGVTTMFKDKADVATAENILRQAEVMVQSGNLTDTATTTERLMTTGDGSEFGEAITSTPQSIAGTFIITVVDNATAGYDIVVYKSTDGTIAKGTELAKKEGVTVID
ncbi:type II secretion system protein [Helicovermis profundi]|uniref:Prepilin-type N-terminal cleavage/methylation domain-containing protein n=1 Tax=Helicovermis profundi TaxID=3065157 RepID=A0AAU9ELQ3_9FIRM|nr:hypothetical protein HLPR_13100 [Clostridia bacterium S502]